MIPFASASIRSAKNENTAPGSESCEWIESANNLIELRDDSTSINDVNQDTFWTFILCITSVIRSAHETPQQMCFETETTTTIVVRAIEGESKTPHIPHP